MNRIKSYNQFLNENLKYPSLYEDEKADLFIPSTNTAQIQQATKINKQTILSSLNIIVEDRTFGTNLLNAFYDQIVNPITATPNLITKPLGADMKIDTNLKSVKITDLSDQAQKGLITFLLYVGSSQVQDILKYLDSDKLTIPIKMEDLAKIPTQYQESYKQAVEKIREDISKNKYNTEFPSLFSINDYLNLNIDRSTVGVANSVNLLLDYMQGKLPKKTNWGSMEGYVYAIILLSVLSGVFMIWGKDILGLGNKIYENGGKKLGDNVYNLCGTWIPGLRDSVKALGDEISKYAETPLGLAISGLLAVYKTGNAIQKILDDDDKIRFQKIGIDSFIPLFNVLPAYSSIVEQSKANIQKYLEDLEGNQSRIDAIRNKMAEVGVEAVVEEYKTKFANEFPIKLKKHFEDKLNVIKSSVGNYPKFLNDINYSAITESVVLGASKLADGWTGLSWFNRYQDPNDAIQDIALLFEDIIELDGYTNKENPFMMLVGSLIYLCINECCIEMPELVIIEGTLPQFNPSKMLMPVRGMKIPPMELPLLKLDLVEKELAGLEVGAESCAVYLTFSKTNGDLLKTKFANLFFKTGQSVFAKGKENNFRERFAKLLASYSGVKLIVTGNADVTGIEGEENSTKGNIPLSKKRAQALVDYMKGDSVINDYIDLDEDLVVYGKGSEYAKSFTQYSNKGVKTGQLVKKEGGVDKESSNKIREQLANDRRIEIYFSFNEEDFDSKMTDEEFIKEYCMMQPNIEAPELIKVQKNGNLVLGSNYSKEFKFALRSGGGDTKGKQMPDKKIRKDDVAPEKVDDSYNNRISRRYILNEAKSCKTSVVKFLKENECEVDYPAGTCKVGTKTMKIEKALLKFKAPASLIKSYSEECSKEINEALRLRPLGKWDWI